MQGSCPHALHRENRGYSVHCALRARAVSWQLISSYINKNIYLSVYIENISFACRFSENSDSILVSSEWPDIILNPPEHQQYKH